MDVHYISVSVLPRVVIHMYIYIYLCIPMLSSRIWYIYRSTLFFYTYLVCITFPRAVVMPLYENNSISFLMQLIPHLALFNIFINRLKRAWSILGRSRFCTIKPFDLYFDLHFLFKQQLWLAKINHAIYFSQSQFLLAKTNEDWTRSRRAILWINRCTPFNVIESQSALINVFFYLLEDC